MFISAIKMRLPTNFRKVSLVFGIIMIIIIITLHSGLFKIPINLPIGDSMFASITPPQNDEAHSAAKLELVINANSGLKQSTVRERINYMIDKDVENLWKNLGKEETIRTVEADMNQRKEQLSRMCDMFKAANATLGNRTSTFLYFRDFKVGWCPVYKAGSSNWKNYFSHLTGVSKKCENLTKIGPFGTCLHNRLLKYSHSAKKVDESTLKFMVVRHPYERVVSAFRDKIEGADKKPYYNGVGRFAKFKYREVPENMTEEDKTRLLESSDVKVHSKISKTDLNNPYENPLGPTFIEFSKAVLLDGKWDMHWASYQRWCGACSLHPDVIVKFETLNRDNLFVLKKLGLPLDGFEAHSNPTKTGGTQQSTWRTYFSMLDKSLVEGYKDMYFIDCELFGYDCDVSGFTVT